MVRSCSFVFLAVRKNFERCFFFRSKQHGHEVLRSTTSACGTRRVRCFAAETPDVEPEILVGNAPGWPVRPGASSFGDEGSNFVDVWKNRAFHADHTGYLRLLDDRRRVVFLRPQRFGKTLWLSTMECYYDVNYADPEGPIDDTMECFSTLFGGLGNDKGSLAIARDETRKGTPEQLLRLKVDPARTLQPQGPRGGVHRDDQR